jgi:hypothetical protein
MKSLITLRLSMFKHNIGDKGLDHLSALLSIHKTLENLKLDVYHNNISDEGVKLFCNNFLEQHACKVKKLEIDFEENNIRGPQIANIC